MDTINSQIVDWPEDRRGIAFMQLYLKSVGFDVGEIDGYLGPQTEYALEVWQSLNHARNKLETWRDDVLPDPDPAGYWPQYDDLEKFYGEPGKNLTRLALPYTMKLAWNLDKEIAGFAIHEKVHDSAKRVFNKIASHYSPEEIETHGFNIFSGCIANPPRKMRGGSKPSTHNWAISIDFDNTRNSLKWGKDRAYLAKPECEQFWKFWEEEDWVSLGRTRNYDFMHVEAVSS